MEGDEAEGRWWQVGSRLAVESCAWSGGVDAPTTMGNWCSPCTSWMGRMLAAMQARCSHPDEMDLQ